MINKQKSKVLFAEANSDVVDVLISFLTLPLGNIVRILEKHYGIDEAPVIGSLTTLYRGLSNLDTSHFCVAGAKQMLLNPTSSFQVECRSLKLDISDQPRKVYYCEDHSKCSNSLASNVSLYSDIAKCVCGKPINRETFVEEQENDANVGVFMIKSSSCIICEDSNCPNSEVKDVSLYSDIAKCGCGKPLSCERFVKEIADDDNVGVFMIKSSSFIICDDLRIVAVDSGFLQTLNNLGITDTDDAELSILSIDIDDMMDLFKFSLFSSTPLTDLVIKKTHIAAKPIPVGFLHHTQNGDANPRKMSLKILLQKSSNKFLLAVASDEFVEFLFSLLAIPLGGVEFLLGGNTCFKNIDNLYKSIRDVFDNKYFRSPDAKNGLMNPKLAHGYSSKNQFLPLIEKIPPKLTVGGVFIPSFKSSKGQGNFLKEEAMYIVSDYLTVTPFSVTSSISIPNGQGIALSDVAEKDFQIGLEEALSILKTSMSSTTVLSDALINPMLNKLPKRPKQER